MGVATITPGCRLNRAESEMMRGWAGHTGMTIGNSCAAISEAGRRTRQAIRRAKDGDPLIGTFE